MTHAPGRLWIALALAALMVVSASFVVGSFTAPTAHSPSVAAPAAVAPTVTPSATPHSSVSSHLTFGIDAGRAATIAADEKTLSANGYTSSQFLPPNLHQAPPLAQTGGAVTPLYSVAPAPTGVAYYGLSNTGSGVQATTVNTTSLQATFSTGDNLGVETESFDFGTQTAYGAQLNAVLTNVTLFGQTAFAGGGSNLNAPTGCVYSSPGNGYCPNQFWLQNVIGYNPSTDALTFENNIWNFSNPSGGWTSGTNAVQGFSTPRGGFYAVNGPSITIKYPFTLALYLNTTRGPCHLDTTPGTGVASCGTVSTTAPVNEAFFNYTVWNSAGNRVCPTNPGTGKVCGEYDDVFFNSVSPSVNPLGVPEYGPNGRVGSATIQANGSAYDPVGLTNDYEMDWGIGTSSGATASVVYANATVGINYCTAANTALSGKCSAFSATPAAYDYGGETGETNTGSLSYWSPQGSLSTTGPTGAGPTLLPGAGTPVAHFVSGPALLIGLWNGSGTAYPGGAGGRALNYGHISPANAWIGIAVGANQTNQSLFQVAPTFGWFSGWTGSGGSPVPTSLGRNLYLPPNKYTIEVLLSGYTPQMQNVDLTSTGQSPTITLVHNLGTGVYTPLWAFSSSDLANISTNYGAFGAGSNGHPYELMSAAPTIGAPYGENGSLAWLFSNLNDYLFDAWLGEYINSTTSYAESNPGPSFLMEYPSWQLAQLAEFDAPTYDQFQFYFFHVQNFTLAGASHIYSWANSEATTVYSVVCNLCHNDLIADNVFAVSDRAIEFINGGTTLSTGNAMLNTRNVIWGNTFVPDPQPTFTGLISPSTGITLSEAYDRVWNNEISTNATASSSAAETNWWNVTCQVDYNPLSAPVYPGPTVCQLASFVTTYLGYSLTGSITGTAYQGGNFWFNYGNVANPYGNLPYVARASSITGSAGLASTATGARGDYAPLISYSVYDPNFFETGISSSATASAFEVRVVNATGYGWLNETQTSTTTTLSPSCSGSTCVVFYLPSGTYSYTGFSGLTGASAVAANPATGTFTISGAALGTVTTFAFSASHAVTFTETGLPAHTTWSISIPQQLAVTSTTTTIVFNLPNGGYTYQIAIVPGYTTTQSGSFTVSGAALAIPVTFTVTVFAVSFSESGLPSGLTWMVTVDATPQSLVTDGGTDTLVFQVANGSHTYTLAGNAGWYQNTLPYSGSLTVTGASVTEPTVSYTQVVYGVSFSETGLPSGLSWSVTFNGVTSSVTTSSGTTSIAFASEANGTYAYSIADNPGYHQSTIAYSGSESVSGAPLAVSVTYGAVTYGVTFSQSGLPSGLTWTVTFNSVTQSLTTSGGTDTLTFASVANGTYSYQIADNPGYHQSTVPYSGTESVNGGALAVSVTYGQVSYGVNFEESGLPSGLSWSVTFNAVTQSLTTSGGTDTLSFASEPNGSYAYSIADNAGYHQSTIAYSGSVSVTGGSLTESLVYTQVTYAVSFAQSGLPSGLTWSVTVNGVTSSLTTSGGTDTLTFASEPNGSYSYSIADNAGYHQSTIAYSGSISVAGGPVAESVTYVQVTYGVSFSESGLPAGLSWSVTVNGGTQSVTTNGGTDTLSFAAEPNGSYTYTIASNPGYSQSTLPYSGSLSVSGAAVAEAVTYAQVTYGVSFSETGLPSGLSWSVTFNAVTQSLTTTSGTNTLTFANAPNGSYSYSIADNAGYHQNSVAYSGTESVNGAALSVSMSYSQVTYSVTFTESGLPASTLWSVSIGAQTSSSTTTTNVLTEPNGTYTYTVGIVSGYRTTHTGSVGVSGANAAVALPFTQVTYSVTFKESGLPGGTSWSVTIGSTTLSSVTTKIVFTLPNGTYAWSVANVANYSRTASGSVTVPGTGVTVTEKFVLVTYAFTLKETGLATGTSWSVTVGADTGTTTSNKVVLKLANGTYSYTIGAIPDYSFVATGTFTINGATVTVTTHFTLVKYTVKFTETGLPSHTSWQVTIGANTYSSSGTSISVTLSNATYHYTASAPSTSLTAPGGMFTVNGAPVGVTVAFS
jgi:hypothetical protein